MFKDDTCEQIINILKDDINSVSQEYYGFNLVRTTRSFYDLVIPVTDMPCLMLSRQTDTFRPGTQIIQRTYFKIDYCESYEAQTRVAAYCHLIATIINSSLNTLNMRTNITKLPYENRRADYNQYGLAKAVSSYLQFYFEASETSIAKTILDQINQVT